MAHWWPSRTLKPCKSCSAYARWAGREKLETTPTRPSGEAWHRANIALCRRFEIDEFATDWAVVDRLCKGGRVRSTHAERVAAVARLTAVGLSANQIVQRMGITKRSVERMRSEIRQAVA